MAGAHYKRWRGKEIAKEVVLHVAAVLGEFGLRAEGHTKKELKKGHGVETGTLRRSIHMAGPTYDWGSDNVEPSSASPERGGQDVEAEIQGNAITISLGSGLNYALPVHQGHRGFEGYHFITNGVDKTKPELPLVLKRHQLK